MKMAEWKQAFTSVPVWILTETTGSIFISDLGPKGRKEDEKNKTAAQFQNLKCK